MKKISVLRIFAILSLMGTIALSGCGEKPTYYKLSDEDMSWLCYGNNQVMNFVSPSGDVITYNIVIRVKAYTVEGNTYSEFTGASITQMDDTTAMFAGDEKGELYICKQKDQTVVTQTWPHFAIQKDPLTGLPATLANIGGLNYTDVFELDASLLADPRNYFTKLWISKSKGVLQMEDLNGTLWVRDF